MDELLSDIGSFNEDDMYGSDHGMEPVSESTDNEGEADIPRSSHRLDVSFSDQGDELLSDVKSFNEDDMYGSDHGMEVVSESTDNEEEVDIPQSSDDGAVSAQQHSKHVRRSNIRVAH